MTATIPPHPLGLDFGAGFGELGEYLRVHPELAARIRSARHVHIPLVGATGPERIADLYDVAREMGTVAEWGAPGFFSASVRFGSPDPRLGAVILEAHHNPQSFIQVQDAAKRAAA